MLPSEEGKEKEKIEANVKKLLFLGLRRGSTLICPRSTPGYNLIPHPDNLDYLDDDDSIIRADLFKLNLGNTPHMLTEEDIRVLGQRTDGYR